MRKRGKIQYPKLLSQGIPAHNTAETDYICSMDKLMSLHEALLSRHSVRKYRPEPIAGEILEKLRIAVEQVNAKSGLHIQLVTNEPKAFSGPMAYGKFSGVSTYLVVACPKSEKSDLLVGYYGEKLVLYAQQLGLNSCWAGVSYRKIKGTYTLSSEEKIACYIALGYGLTQGVQHKGKSLEDISNADSSTPQWFNDGVKAALLAPTAVNQQKFYIEYKGGPDGKLPKVSIRVNGLSLVGYTRMDLGIAKLHFEIGAGTGNFVWD